MIFSSSVRLDAAAVSNMGLVRRNNEDNLFFDGKYINEEQVNCATHENICFSSRKSRRCAVYGICDGMGGESHGELAALIAAEEFDRLNRRMHKLGKKSVRSQFEKFIDSANTRICDKITELGVTRIGTTYAMLMIKSGVAYISNIGDSRVYHLRGDSFKQMTKDHTELQYYIDAGVIAPEQARGNPMRHGLTQHLGIFKNDHKLVPYYAELIKLQKGDLFLLCSDGLTDMLEDSAIKSICSGDKDSADIAAELVNTAVELGGHDNTTVIVVKII